MQASAAVLRAFNQPLSLEPVAVPRLRAGQVLVEVEAAGVCGSDVHMWRGLDPRTPLPIILGHEGVGRVLDTCGARIRVDDRSLSPGDRILWERGVTCGACHACVVLGEPALCPHRWAYGIHHSLETPPHLNGCYSTHLILDARTPLFPLSESVDPAVWVSASCSGATAAHGFALTPVRAGDSVVVMGPGPLGAYSVALAAAGGAEQVFLIGGTETRLNLCRALGATQTLNRRTLSAAERYQAILDATQGRGADLVVEASGSLAAATEGLSLLRPGGALSLVGLGAPAGALAVELFEQVARKNVRMQGVWVSDARHTAAALSLVRRNPAPFAALVTHRQPLQQAAAALEAVANRAAMKAVLLPQAAG